MDHDTQKPKSEDIHIPKVLVNPLYTTIEEFEGGMKEEMTSTEVARGFIENSSESTVIEDGSAKPETDENESPPAK